MTGVTATGSNSGAAFPPVPAALTASIVYFTVAACYLRFFVLPDVPILPSGDAIGFVDDGARIVAGQLPYRDFFEIVPPGTPLVYAALIRIFGWFNWIPLAAMTGLAGATVLLMTLAASRVMRWNAVALPALLLSGFILLESADATHHWFSTVWVLAGMLALFDKITFPRILAAGVFCGLAACFTQSKGATAVAGFVTYLWWKSWRENGSAAQRWRRCLTLCGAAVAVFGAVNLYFVRAAGFGRWFYCLVVYPVRFYSAPAVNNWRVILFDFQWHRGAAAWIAFPFVYLTVPLVYIVFLFAMRRRWRKDRDRPWDQLLLVALTGIAMFLAIATSPSVKRLSSASPPAMILLAWFFDRPGRTASALRAGLGMAAVALAMIPAIRTQTRQLAKLDLPAGRTAISPLIYEEYSWLLSHTHPGQFFWGAPLNLPFHLRNPAAIEGIDASEYTRPEDVAALVQALQQHQVPMMILPSEEKYPLTVGRPANHLGPFVEYLHANYQLIRTFANGDEVWEKLEDMGNVPSARTFPTFYFPLQDSPPRENFMPSRNMNGSEG